jgi:xanthine dehydrogenase accessory factor
MAALFATLLRVVERDGAAALVTVTGTRGSTPREAGSRMLVARGGAIAGTIGGGRLELDAIERAEALIAAGGDTTELFRLALGPSLGQCCGGDVQIAIEAFGRARLDHLGDLARAEAAGPFQTEARLVEGRPTMRAVAGSERRMPFAAVVGDVLAESFGRPRRDLLLFGAGHVGRALVLALSPLPFSVRWIDERAEAFPDVPFANLTRVVSARPAAEIAGAPEEAFVLIMTHDHGLDLEILDAALALDRLPYIGLIGSATKRARFEHRLMAAGHPEARARSFACPIGIPGISSKEPALIAASVVAELLIEDQKIRSACSVRRDGTLEGAGPENRRSAQIF